MKSWLFLHHRSASMWTSALVSEYAQTALGHRTCGGLNSFRGEPSDEAVKEALTHPWGHDMNAWPSLPAQLDKLCGPDTWGGPHEWRAVHLVRDPRDVLISAYFSCRDYHPTTDWPELGAFKSWLNRVDEETGIIATMGWVSFALESYAGWEPRSNVLEIHYEDLFASERHRHNEHYQTLLALLDWLFPPADPALVTELMHKHCWAHKTGGRRRGDEDTSHHYRKGIAGGWHKHWTPRIAEVWRSAYGYDA